MLRIKEVYCREPMCKALDIYLNGRVIDALGVYCPYEHGTLKIRDSMCFSLLGDYLFPYLHMNGNFSKVFLRYQFSFAITPINQLLKILESLRMQGVEVIFDLNYSIFYDMKDQSLYNKLYKINDDGYEFCFNVYDWKKAFFHNMINFNGIFKYARIGPPPINELDFKHYLDFCFMMKETWGVHLILDCIQSQDELDLANLTPYFALGLDFFHND
ncbi:MAG: hypothetical protein ACRC9O_12990 [Plesiomonas sp.]|uniref:hypothetical protein n=1 Tax=Plesiomonas sp. TaxID=2486279 RepID=UPI003F2CC2C6